ncbi:hypothetical protein IWQ60_007662 [Tieghemiomyces parasiticus]|uniref:Thioredoxin-like fold domain-containing protein n=1 Tax=Tieghemiomyces parasiticus TaxID=78921 RepID=A0A9W7ZZY4_9FUNG|nr:hypothetical protein IWQ60_007662 [Tieghemiomyces parasiticus]
MTCSHFRPIPSGHRLGAQTAPVVLEAYLDYACPFSRRFFERYTKEVVPFLEKHYSNQVQLIFRHQVQPWHPQSAVLHEAALAVERINQTAFYSFSAILFEKQEEYFDAAVHALSRDQLHQRLAQLASGVGVDPDAVAQQLALDTKAGKNTGTSVTNELKLHIKLGRQQGIHASPTVLYNGLVDNSISSAWTLEQWMEFFAGKLEA